MLNYCFLPCRNTLTNHVMVLLEDHNGTPVESYTQIFQAKLIMEARHSETKWHLNPALLASAEIVWKETVKNVTYVLSSPCYVLQVSDEDIYNFVQDI